MIITIDGPVASGKSTIAKHLAKRLSIYYLYSGLLYRAIIYILLMQQKPQPKPQDYVTTTKKILEALTQEQLTAIIADLEYSYHNDMAHITYRGTELTTQLTNVVLDASASLASANPLVRKHLLVIQRNVAKQHDVVADGRDCGSVIFPNANYKFYLTADITVRAQRFIVDTSRTALGFNLETIKKMIEQRDLRDQQREIAPLTIPDGAIVIDNSEMNIEQTIQKFLSFIKK